MLSIMFTDPKSQGLPKHAVAAFETLSNVTSASQNYSGYRESLAGKELPFSPNIAVHLRDLTFVSKKTGAVAEKSFFDTYR